MRLKVTNAKDNAESAIKHRSLVFTLCTVCICFLLYSEKVESILAKWDVKILETRFYLRGELPADKDIVILSIDESSLDPEILTPEVAKLHPALAKMAQGWPYDRSVYAHVINRLAEAGARAIVFDIVFPSPSGPGDFDFADAIAAHQDKLILGYRFTKLRQQGVGLDEIGTAAGQFKIEYPFDDLLPLDDTGLLGLVNVWPSIDESIRQHKDFTTDYMEHFGRAGGTRHDTLAFATATKIGEAGAPHPDFYYINFRGGPRSFEYVQVEQLFLPSHWKNQKLQSGAFFKNKIVLIGPVAERFKDSYPTPVTNTGLYERIGQLMPGVEIHANILSTIRSGSYILPVSSSTIFTITLVIALFAQLLAHSLRQPAVRALITLVILGLFFVITQWIFVEHLTYIAALKPVCALFILSTIFIVYDFTLEQHERNRVRSYLDRYVTRNVADVILNDRGDFEESLKGKRSEVCIFFSDIRGFTTLSENLDPEELVALLNEYFNPMVDIVLKADGTLQKFIGDAIMAVWGDTLHMSEEDKAVKAVKASLEMLEALASLNSSITARGYAPLGIGIGLNYGEAIVGNIGHAQRMEFTVLGDAVNLAARLEGATKVYHQQILVGESVYKLAGNKIAFRFVANLLVKGKETAVPVYTPITEQSKMTAVARDWLATYETAIQHFFDRDFEAARKAFEIANEALGNEDYICQSYIKKCIVFKQNPPPSDWDGTDKLTTK